ncbi:hypothetical protein [Bacteroides timonensis]|nr:hypothetical protein [Bacteroides timonensis]
MRMLISQGKYELLPTHSIELTSPWDLGGDGKTYYGYHSDCDWMSS